MLVILGVCGIIGSQVGSLIYQQTKPKPEPINSVQRISISSAPKKIPVPDFSKVPSLGMPGVSSISSTSIASDMSIIGAN
jgi:hypothetical protein